MWFELNIGARHAQWHVTKATAVTSYLNRCHTCHSGHKRLKLHPPPSPPTSTTTTTLLIHHHHHHPHQRHPLPPPSATANNPLTMSTKAAKHVYAVMKRRLGDVMKALPNGGERIEEIEEWGMSFVKIMVSRTSEPRVPQITLTVSPQNDYHDAARAAEEAVGEDDVEAFFASATALLDPYGRQDWIEGAGGWLLPKTAKAQAQGEAE